MGLIPRRWIAWLKAALPPALRGRLKALRSSRRVKSIMAVSEPLTLAQFAAGLRELGVEQGQTLFVHSGADWLRTLEGGPMAALKLLVDLVGPEGTLAMPSFPFDGVASEYVRANLFDVRRSPSKMGLMTELFRRLPGVRRSLHPTHPVCVLGPRAGSLTAGHHRSPLPFGPLSPFGQLGSAKILMIGVDTTVLTHVHVIEDSMGDRFPVRVYLSGPINVPVIDAEGIQRPVSTFVHDPSVSRLKSISGFEDTWEDAGILRKVQVCHVKLRLLDAEALAADLVRRAVAGQTIYG